jgi:type II secretory pathway pseudopilin PulG
MSTPDPSPLPPPLNPQPAKAGNSCLLIGLIGGACAFILIGVVAVLAAIAVPSFMKARDRALEASALAKALSLFAACHAFASDQPDGGFPPTLDDLLPEYIGSEAGLIDPLAKSTTSPRFSYFRPNADDPPDTVVLRSARTKSGVRIEVRKDGSTNNLAAGADAN